VQVTRSLPVVVLVIVALSCNGSGVTDPIPASFGGQWLGSFEWGGREPWLVEIAVEQEGDSLQGSGAVSFSAPDWSFHEVYDLAGTVQGNSITFRLRPVEDATFNFTGTVKAGVFSGRVWTNANVGDATALILKQGAVKPSTAP
jgi:hypothetical protein